MPGPGAKGIGDVAMRNYDAWKNIRVNMDTITDNEPVNTELDLFGHTFKYPILQVLLGLWECTIQMPMMIMDIMIF